MKTQVRKTVAAYAALTFAGAFSFPAPNDLAISSASAHAVPTAEVTPLLDTAGRIAGIRPDSQGTMMGTDGGIAPGLGSLWLLE